jgi:ABC-type polysaccharide/polyol phosphate export permease
VTASQELSGGFELHRESTSLSQLLRDVWRCVPLILALARQNFYVRYRRTTLGVLWAVGIPLLQALVLAFVFSQIVRIGRVDHYVVFVLAGITAWAYFSSTVQGASTSIVENASLSTRIYFPRVVFPLVIVGANLPAFVLGVPILLVAAVVDGLGIGLRVLWLVPATVLLVALSASFSIVFSALHVYFRDVRYLVQAAFLAWLYATPVIYSIDQAQRFDDLLPVNPATGVVLIIRAAVIGRDRYFLPSIAWTVGWTIALLVVGLLLHRRYDRVFADLL